MDQEKTQEPTEHKIQEAHKKGDFPISLDFVHFVMFMIAAWFITWLIPRFLKNFRPVDLFFILACLGIFSVTSILSVIIQTRGKLKPFEIKFEKLSIQKGFSRIFSKQAIIDFCKNMLKAISLILVIWFFVLRPLIVNSTKYTYFSVKDNTLILKVVIGKIFLMAAIVFFFIAIIDLFLQRRAFIEKLKMTFQELKDEHKELEGDPKIKSRIRSIMSSKLRFMMKKEVERSTAIITNPTHYAVAIFWEKNSKIAPVVTAKGVDHLAFKIIEIAKDKSVPVVENKKLARSLFQSVEVGSPIPVEYYKAVAQIIKLILKAP